MLKRALFTLYHLLTSSVGLVRGLTLRHRALLIFTHAQDRDSKGVDQQLGALVARCTALRIPLVEVRLIPLSDRRGLRATSGRPLFSAAVIFALARILAWVSRRPLPFCRAAIAEIVLRVWRPVALVLIDETGSGQPLVRAARRLGIRTVGVQHGDFRPDVLPYCDDRDRIPVDVLAVWSPWFRERLLAVSAIYDESNVTVTGRLRTEHPSRLTTQQGVLVLEESDPKKATILAPFFEELERTQQLEVRRRPHPAQVPPGSLPSLASDLESVRVVVGLGSSALLEAIRFSRVVVVPMTILGDPLGLTGEGLANRATSPEDLVSICLALTESTDAEQSPEDIENRIFGGSPMDPAAEILALIGNRALLGGPGLGYAP